MTDETTLLPCPMCGGQAIFRSDVSGLFCVRCVSCGLRTATHWDDPDQPKREWNRRYVEDDLK